VCREPLTVLFLLDQILEYLFTGRGLWPSGIPDAAGPYRRTRRAAVVRVCPVGVLRGSRAANPAGGVCGGRGVLREAARPGGALVGVRRELLNLLHLHLVVLVN
jgi:hypothetical protein